VFKMRTRWTDITDFTDKEYEVTIGSIGLRDDPFPIQAPSTVDYWANNEELFRKLRSTLVDAMIFPTSNIYIFYGDVGVGKTFAARLMCHPSGLKLLFSELPEYIIKEPYVFIIDAVVPRRSGELTSTAYRNIIEKMLEEIRQDTELRQFFLNNLSVLPSGNVNISFQMIGRTFRQQTIERTTYDLSSNEGFKFVTDQRNKIGKITDINQISSIIKYLFYVMLQKYDRINLVVDECENLSEAPLSDRYQFSDLIKTLYNDIPNKMNIFLVYTQDTYIEIEKTLQRALLDRIKDKIYFKLVNSHEDLIIYIRECIKKRGKIEYEELITDEVLNKFSRYLISKYGRISFRDVNKEMHMLISKCYQFKMDSAKGDKFSFKIDEDAYLFYTTLFSIRG